MEQVLGERTEAFSPDLAHDLLRQGRRGGPFGLGRKGREERLVGIQTLLAKRTAAEMVDLVALLQLAIQVKLEFGVNEMVHDQASTR